MYRGSDFVGKPVFAYDIGKKLDTTVKELILSQSRKKLIGFVVATAPDPENLILPLDRVHFNPDVVTIDSEAVLVPIKERELKQIMEQSFRNSKVITTQGQDLGTVVDIYFDAESGVIEGYEVSGGFLADTYSGRSFIPATEETTIQNNVIFVSPDAALIKDQVGGIQGAIQKAKEKAQATARSTSEKLQEAAQAAGEKVQNIGEPLQQPNSQQEPIKDDQSHPLQKTKFVLGKIVRQTVYTKRGTPLIVRGQKVTPAIAAAAQRWQALDQLLQAVSSEPISITLEQAMGRKVLDHVRDENGLLIAASGQIVDELVLEQARLCQREKALLEAVGLSGDGSTDSSIQKSVEHFKAGAQQLQQGVNHLWQHVQKISGVKEEQGEEQQIRNALGRPVKRVVFDQQNQVILDVGELITFQAIERAKQAGVVNILLDAVYKNET